ncbi:10929_t:CDS:2 [Funneliformis mosseae]|uniref:10929_t:CDS:1 n=1 Tax=Funneliformis mosseae TaxID=27381 RepID=A0A9N9ABA5_FUNMO|nr:10929_t:CDS:2 [Funneliformis mosseae]
MPKRNFKKFIIIKFLKFLTKSRIRFRFNFNQNYLILPLPLLVLFQISFTKELIIILIHSLICDNESNAGEHNDLLIQQITPQVIDIDSEDKHEEAVEEYPEGDSCVLECHSLCVSVRRIVHCFGVTREPKTGYYMMVTNFANEGDLNSYIKKRHQDLNWERIIRLSRDIAKALRGLHREGNRKDRYGFRAAEEKRSLILSKMAYPEVINSQQIFLRPRPLARRFNQSENIFRQNLLIKSNNDHIGSHEYSCAIDSHANVNSRCSPKFEDTSNSLTTPRMIA